MASLNGKSTEDSSSNEDSADKSDEADIQELAEDEIQESVEDAQETVKGGVQEAIYQRSAGGRSSDINLVDIPCIYFLFLLLLFEMTVYRHVYRTFLLRGYLSMTLKNLKHGTLGTFKLSNLNIR